MFVEVWKSNSEGTLTFAWAIHIALVSCLGGILAAMIGFAVD
jgi:hypothetical protein